MVTIVHILFRMANRMGKLTTVVSEQLEKSVRAAVASGDYSSAGDAVADAVKLWAKHRRSKIVALKAAVKDGIASGIAGPLNIDGIKQAARSEFEKRARRAAE
jgi:putative addiction module CopG family antidote